MHREPPGARARKREQAREDETLPGGVPAELRARIHASRASMAEKATARAMAGPSRMPFRPAPVTV